MEEIHSFIKSELGSTPDIRRLDSDLTTIINILSRLDLSNNETVENINSFEIEKKITFNSLTIAALFIKDYKLFYSKLDKKYQEFDKFGSNKSMAVLQTIRRLYIDAIVNQNYKNNDQLFLGILDKVKELVINSRNYEELPVEELEVCVGILVVDAFTRCKIFENPEDYNYAIT